MQLDWLMEPEEANNLIPAVDDDDVDCIDAVQSLNNLHL